MKIIIYKHDFDTMENRNPEYKDVIDITNSLKKANLIIKKLIAKDKKLNNHYKGYYNDTLYPYYTKKVLK